MTRGARRTLFLVAAAALGGLFVWGFRGLPDFGRFHGAYGELLNRVAVPERHATNVVTATVFDYRGFDTMGEEFILFAAAIGTALLLRASREDEPGSPAQAPEPSDALRVLAAPLAAALVSLGLYVVAHGAITPGGGFQGGVVLAAAPVLAFLTAGYAAFARIGRESLVELVEGLALAGFVSVGLAGDHFLGNLLPLGGTGTLSGGGTIALLNGFTAAAVGAGFVLFFAEFLEETPVGGGRR